MLEFGNFRIDFDRRLVFERGRTVVLAPKVFDLLAYLVRNYGRVVSRDELNENVWDGSPLGAANIAQHVLLLRRALGDVRKPHKYVSAVHGTGYAFVREPRESVIASGHAPPSLTPMQLYSNARYHCEQRTAPAVRAALQLFDAAIEAQPADAKLHAGKAQAHLLMATYLYAAPKAQLRLARESSSRALALDESCVDALCVQALLALIAHYDAEHSLTLLERTASLRPDLPLVYQLRAQCLVVLERFDEAVLAAHEGLAWHPASVAMNTLVGYALYAGGRYADARAHLAMVLDLDRNARNAAYFHAMSCFMLGDVDTAIEQLRTIVAQRECAVRGEPDVLQHAGAALAFVLNAVGKPHESAAVLRGLEALSDGRVIAPSHRAIALAGAKEAAVKEALQDALSQADPWVVFAPVSHFFDVYRGRAWYDDMLISLRAPRTLQIINGFSTPA